ncbi:hypothetical protein F884_00509 [Acinetobacter sp. CIP 102143]|jgi:hypothetical protein|nr:hypothetical protein F884_00509 [Acinetobacter sp. CIP 102143]
MTLLEQQALPEVVLGKSVLRAAKQLCLSQFQLAIVLIWMTRQSLNYKTNLN